MTSSYPVVLAIIVFVVLLVGSIVGMLIISSSISEETPTDIKNGLEYLRLILVYIAIGGGIGIVLIIVLRKYKII